MYEVLPQNRCGRKQEGFMFSSPSNLHVTKYYKQENPGRLSRDKTEYIAVSLIRIKPGVRGVTEPPLPG